MKLTTYHREAFVNGVMGDVPEEDIDGPVHDYVKKLLREKLPATIVATIDNPKLCPYIRTTYIHFPGRTNNFEYAVPENLWPGFKQSMTKSQTETLEKLMLEADAKGDKVQNLVASLKGAIASVTTLKQALELFPEFTKYLPAGTEKASNLPMVVNVVADLVKAGWPKDKKPAKRAK